MKTCVPSVLFSALWLGLPAGADVIFTVQFEPGSKWFTESWSAAARIEMGAFFADLGNLFEADAQVVVQVNDDEQNAFASAETLWDTTTEVDGRAGVFSAPSVWSILVKGVDENGGGADVRINWNLDVASLYGGDSGRLIRNIRGLARHEMHHPFGSSSWLYHSTSFDPRGTLTQASLIDSLYRDANNAPLLGSYNSVTRRFTVNNYPLAGTGLPRRINRVCTLRPAMPAARWSKCRRSVPAAKSISLMSQEFPM